MIRTPLGLRRYPDGVVDVLALAQASFAQGGRLVTHDLGRIDLPNGKEVVVEAYRKRPNLLTNSSVNLNPICGLRLQWGSARRSCDDTYFLQGSGAANVLNGVPLARGGRWTIRGEYIQASVTCYQPTALPSTSLYPADEIQLQIADSAGGAPYVWPPDSVAMNATLTPASALQIPPLATQFRFTPTVVSGTATVAPAGLVRQYTEGNYGNNSFVDSIVDMRAGGTVVLSPYATHIAAQYLGDAFTGSLPIVWEGYR